MEKLMILDENGVSTGILKDRDLVHRDGDIHGTSQIFVYRVKNGKTEILLQRRNKDKESFPGCLDISCAGHVSEKMSFIETAVKELEEELGFSVSESELLQAFMQKSHRINVFHGKRFNDNQVSMVYILNRDTDAEKIRFQKEEISQVLWMESEKLLKMVRTDKEGICIDEGKLVRVLEIIEDIRR